MRKYLINTLNIDNFSLLITLLDYETEISKYLKSVKVLSFNSKKVLIDTALCSGMNDYRFIAATLNNDGTININDCSYTKVNPLILEKANGIIQHEPISLNNSILTTPQINALKNK
ncbi:MULTISPECIES: type II toxin-antitoxin system RnlB family antitoxin [Clostridium]|jgi:hypothetical protein|uniref:type II toxin-antitoxin system RnlB family antitoxin n=1 Tax=Clostridium TaxID=1485 RepID=UPI00242A74AA|nr:type II toxin-antitoxin system RnlB family antitoxin [Clostridium tyrobutyricum]